MSASVVATPTQQGVTKLPTAAHLRTNLLNGNVRVSSQTNTVGGQPAFYEVTGGSITNNVKVALPDISSDDTLVTQNGNISWGGGHTFTQGLNAQGPIVTNSSITGSSVSANNLTVSTALSSGGTITSGDTITAKNHVNAGQNMNAGAALTVGTTGTIGGNLTAASSAFQVTSSQITHSVGSFTVNSTGILHLGSIQVQGNGFATNSTQFSHNLQQTIHHPITGGYLTAGNSSLVNWNGNSSDSTFYGIAAGSTNGLIIGTTTTQHLGFFNVAGVVQAAGGARGANTTYGSNEQYMLGQAYNQMRNLGLLAP